jgi:hypothetical protein
LKGLKSPFNFRHISKVKSSKCFAKQNHAPLLCNKTPYRLLGKKPFLKTKNKSLN